MATRGASLRRGLDILLALGSEAALNGGALGVTRIAALTGYEKSQVSRTLRILTEYRLAERSPGTRAFRLGWACFTLAARAGEPRLIENGRLALEQLVQEVGEPVHLSALHGAEVLTLLTQPTSHAVAARNWVGQKIPAYCTSSGRALLFDHGPDALFELFGPEPFPPQGPNAPADVGELERRIRRSRQLGYATADEESEPGLVAAAAPIRDFSGAVVAAINVSAPKFRLGTRLDPTGELVRAAAGRLSEGLGAPVLPDAPRMAVSE